MCDVMNLQALKEHQYYNIQSGYILPHVRHTWHLHNTAILAALSDTPIIVAGNARHDSPGHNATFGTYTLLDINSNIIVAQETVQVSEDHVENSYWLEIIGLTRCLDHNEAHNVKVNTIATDRHGGVRKMLREDHPEIIHEYDLWHITKGLKKKLNKTGNKQVLQWQPAIANHLWYSAATCDSNADILKTKWLSMMYHIQNKHNWGLALGTEMTRCDHEPYSAEEASQRPWISEESDAFGIIQRIVSSNSLLSDLERVIKQN